ncbi:hypothetical protein VSR34_32200 [Paraburkholderia sp. JHI2823]|uniref:hypothetical protein n=1 Tax=Paraburkholderia TaxID=1822464 RepID=UPI00040E119F|nr:hypothetical protein [Paraburkholderia mimosarum]
MATPITTTNAKRGRLRRSSRSSRSSRAFPGWLWFVLLWCAGAGAAVSLGFAFKVFMNLTLFAVNQA